MLAARGTLPPVASGLVLFLIFLPLLMGEGWGEGAHRLVFWFLPVILRKVRPKDLITFVGFEILRLRSE